MAGSGFYRLGRIAGKQFNKARWLWQSVAGSEAEAIRAEYGVGRDMAAVMLEETPRDPDRTNQALVDEVGERLAAAVRNRLHRFEMHVVQTQHPTALALPGGFIFVGRSLMDLCDRDKHEVAFVVAHEMAHVIRRHAIERLLKQKIMSAAAMASPGRGALAVWIRQVGVQWLERAYSREQEYEADELGLRLSRAAGFDPAGAIRALTRLGELERPRAPIGLDAYLSTHPPVEERVRRLRSVIT